MAQNQKVQVRGLGYPYNTEDHEVEVFETADWAISPIPSTIKHRLLLGGAIFATAYIVYLTTAEGAHANPTEMHVAKKIISATAEVMPTAPDPGMKESIRFVVELPVRPLGINAKSVGLAGAKAVGLVNSPWFIPTVVVGVGGGILIFVVLRKLRPITCAIPTLE